MNNNSTLLGVICTGIIVTAILTIDFISMRSCDMFGVTIFFFHGYSCVRL